MLVKTASPEAMATTESVPVSQTTGESFDAVETTRTVPPAETTQPEQPTKNNLLPAQENLSPTTTVATASTGNVALAEKAAAERKFWEEARLLAKLRDCETSRSEADFELDQARLRKKELEKELAELEQKLPELEEAVDEAINDTLLTAKALWRLSWNDNDEPATEAPKAIINQSETPAQPPAVEQAAAEGTPAPVSEPGRDLATSELLAGLDGVGAAKVAAISEKYPTVGALEQMFETAASEKKPVKGFMPKGVGLKVIELIKDCLAQYIATQAKAAAGVNSNALADELLAALRAQATDGAWRPEDCVPDATDSEQTHLGHAAFKAGKPHTALPTQNPELARQWILGWICAEIIARHEQSSIKAAAECVGAIGKQSTDSLSPPTLAADKPKRGRKPKAAKTAETK